MHAEGFAIHRLTLVVPLRLVWVTTNAKAEQRPVEKGRLPGSEKRDGLPILFVLYFVVQSHKVSVLGEVNASEVVN